MAIHFSISIHNRSACHSVCLLHESMPRLYIQRNLFSHSFCQWTIPRHTLYVCFFYLRVLLTFGRLTLDVGTALLLFACCFDLGQGWKLRLRGYCISQLSCSFVHLENSRSSIWAGPWWLRCSITSAVYWKNKKIFRVWFRWAYLKAQNVRKIVQFR